MPRVLICSSVASLDYAYTEGETVEVTGERAQELLRHGWAEIVRGDAPETPEGRGREVETPERRRVGRPRKTTETD